MNEHAQAAARFAALSSPSRVLICHLLRERGGTITVEELEGMLAAHGAVLSRRGKALSQPTVSHHLGVLYRAGLVDYQRDGQHRYYRIAPEGFRWFTAYLAPFRAEVPV